MTSAASVRAGYAAMVTDLATRLRTGLESEAQPGLLLRFAEEAGEGEDRTAALAAIRILGADTLAVHLLAGMAPAPEEQALVREAVALYPRPADPPPQLAWPDWALGRAGVLCGFDLPHPAPTEVPDGEDWSAFSDQLVTYASVALPGLGGPLHDVAAASAEAIARGASRAVLRRDHTAAGALVRWLALVQSRGRRVPLDIGLLATHVDLLGGDARTRLDVAVAGRLLRSAA